MSLFVPVISHLRYIPIPKILITEYNIPTHLRISPKLHQLLKRLHASSDDDEEISIITYEEGKKAFGIFKQYIEQLDHATANDISFLNNLMKKAEKECIDKLKQSKLDLYF